MAITIGRKLENDYTNPLGMLSDCHRRIERFLALLLTVTKEIQGQPLQPEYRTAFTTALRYFREGAPKHTLDEEESLFPRLHKSPKAQAMLCRLADLHADHAVAEARHHTVEVLGSRWLDEETLTPTDVQSLAEKLEQLSALYQRHIAIEDAEIFPLAGQILKREELAEIAQEMAARRGLRWDAQLATSVTRKG
ncbi:MAG: hemerythrin domain-containing protein [Blastocatellia bacterium]